LQNIYKIAFKYFFSIRGKNIVNIITLISTTGVLFGTMAMIIVLSVFNGFDEIIKNLYRDVDHDFKLELKDGGNFKINEQIIDKINSIDGIISYSEVLDHKMLGQYLDNQLVLNVKGVDNNYFAGNMLINNLITDSIIASQFFNNKNPNYVLCGIGVFNLLELKLLDFNNPLKISFFQEMNTLNIDNILKTNSFYLTGVYETHTDFDHTSVLLNIASLRDILSTPQVCSSIEISIDKTTNSRSIEQQLSHYFSSEFIVKNRFNQQPFIYKMVQTEKLAVYIIFSFILIISMLSLIASLIVLLMEKQKDIQVLYSIGFKKNQIKNIFFIVGLLINLFGTLLGNIFGLAFCFLQFKFKFLNLGEGASSFIQSYPISVNILDILLINVIVMTLGVLTAYIVSRNQRFYQYN
tara:strand:+ start:62066 stop:63289 length:1224 start_codon:yes stop_codon:yes gene_type:complete